MRLFGDAYLKRPVLITGHTGFKGSWLTQWLVDLGAVVTGFALEPETVPNHWRLLALDISDLRGDIRDRSAVDAALLAARPEIVFHLAAQPLVRRSYREPLETWSTNVVGTANVLEACRKTPSVKAVVVVTTDKVYANHEWPWGYRENDRLGGHDPYSASKAAAELVVDSYRKAFFSSPNAPLLATARAGNVIGGGDWSEDRLIPDLVRALESGQQLEIRSPSATRPWQHVLDCLSGYLLLGQNLLEGRELCADAWNFGPEADGNCTVAAMLAELHRQWTALAWQASESPQPHEANFLHLDSTKARSLLGWKPVWPLEESLAATADWYKRYLSGDTLMTSPQINSYVARAAALGRPWIEP